jgi:hydrogenase maturation protein HypF
MSEEEIINLYEKKGLIDYFPRGMEELHQCVVHAKSGKGPRTSSTGRVLDSISALLKLCKERTYEGEPAILLEDHAWMGSEIELAIPDPTNEEGVIPTTDLVYQVACLTDSLKSRDIAHTAQLAIGKLLGMAAVKEAIGLGVKVVYISGGAAVNDYIIQGVQSSIRDAGLTLRMHKRLPPNDGCISAGQAFMAIMLGLA